MKYQPNIKCGYSICQWYLHYLCVSSAYIPVIFGRISKKAKETNAEFLFGCKRQEQLKFADLRSTSSVIKQLTGVDYIECMITHSIIPDAGAVVISNRFLQNHKIWFNENSIYRYGEDFVYKCFLAANHLAQVAVVMQVDDEKSVLLNQNHTSQDIFAPFEEVECLLRTLVFFTKTI